MRRILLLAVLAFTMSLLSCRSETHDYRQDMRDFVVFLRAYTDAKTPEFLLIPQNGEELLTLGDGYDTPPVEDYIAAIDGQGREDLLYGYVADNKPTAPKDTAFMRGHLVVAKNHGVQPLVTDYCWTVSNVDRSYDENARWDFISFAAPSRDLDIIPDYPPEPFNVNENDILALADARNFLYLLDPHRFKDRQSYLSALVATSYDILIIDAFFDEHLLTVDEVATLKTKPNGARRLVFAYMSIGEAEDYRYYWQESWRPGNPEWIESENPDWEGNYIVQYWHPEWQAIIAGAPESYLDKILASEFDGAYLDIIDAYEYFE